MPIYPFGVDGYNDSMNVAKKMKTVELDERGRITLPKEFRQDVASFTVEQLKDGSFHLVPRKTVSLGEAEVLESLKKSISDFKKKKTKRVPSGWME